jgi:tyramine---L-glutamate ligase
MPVFVHEFFCSGAFDGDLSDSSLAREGLAMLAAVVADFSQVAGETACGRDSVVTTLDRRLRGCPAVARLEERAHVFWVESPDRERCLFSELARAAHGTLVIAPETGGILLERRRITDAAGGRFLGPSLEAIWLCGDKLSLFEHLMRHSIPTIPTVRFDPSAGSDELQFPIVVKPRDGAGSVDTVLIRGADEFHEFATKLGRRRPLTPDRSPARGEGRGLEGAASVFSLPQQLHFSLLSPRGRGAGGEGASVPGCDIAHHHSERIVQPFVPGRALSTAVLIDSRDGRIDVLPLGEQRLTNDGRFGYRGGRIPAVDLAPTLATAVVDLVGEVCRTLPGLSGWVGFDLIVSSQAPHVRIVEVNPRLTTSYVGYRRLTGANLAARMLGCFEARESSEWDCGPRAVNNAFRVALAARPPVLPSPLSDEDTGGQAASGTRRFRSVEFDADGTVRDI